MKFIPNDWKAIRALYTQAAAEIHAAGRNEWGLPAYSWEGLAWMTPIEALLWHDIRACDAVLYPQYPAGRFFVDFANPVAQVAIECDGAAYHQDKDQDRERDEILGSMGWSVYRITGSDCFKDCDRETGATGPAKKFIEDICHAHGISRNTRTLEEADRYNLWVQTNGSEAGRILARLCAESGTEA